MHSLSITTLGVLQVHLNGQPVTAFGTDKARALFVYLAVESAKPQSRERLAGLLWSDQPDERALHNLRQALSSLRKAIPDPADGEPFLLITPDSIQFNPAADAWVDVGAFHTFFEDALRYYQRRTGRISPALGAARLHIGYLQQAAALYRGHFLEQIASSKVLAGAPLFDEWVAMQREDARRRMAEALSLLAEYHERRGEYLLARQVLTRLAALATWDESVHTQLMRLLAIDGQWSAAQAQYRVCQRYLQDELGVVPTQETTALFDKIRSAAARSTGAQSGIFAPNYPPSRHNLPLATNVFVGRSDELNDLADSLANPHCRLLTVLGPGGIGKTRLALEAARMQVGIFPDGVFWVGLASIHRAEQMTAEVAAAVGLTFPERANAHKSLLEQLLGYLRGKNMLLVLDNFEHLLLDRIGLDVVAEILQTAPGVMLLITSRERLNLQEECLYPLDGLEYPSKTGALTDRSATSYSAMDLFLNHVRRLLPKFELSDQEAPAVIRICQLLDGLPLGVELAAASVWNYSCGEIAQRIAQNLDVLSATTANLPLRHRSLRAAFQVSWQLLSCIEQEIFCQLAVFEGGCEEAAAQYVTGASTAQLSSLVDKSLLRRSASGRYDLHETVRQYAAEHLEARVELARMARLRHAQVYADWLAGQNASLKGPAQKAALTAIGLEFENIRRGWRWMIENRQVDWMTACMDSLYHYLNIRSGFADGIELFRQAAEVLPTPLPLGMALSRLGALALRSRQSALVQEALERCHALLNHCQEVPEELAFCLVSLGGMHLRKKNYALARQCAHDSLVLYRRTGDRWGESYALYLSGLIEMRCGDHQRASPFLRVAVDAARATGDQRRVIAPLNVLGDIACVLGDYRAAMPLFLESLEISQKLDDRFNQAILLNNLASVYQVLQQYEAEQAALEGSLAICREIGDRDGEAIALNSLGEMAVHRRQYAEALNFSQQALEIACQIGEDWTVAVCLNNLGEASAGLGQYAAAERYLSEAIHLAHENSLLDTLARCSINLGRVYQLQNRTALARLLLQAALAHPATDAEQRQKAVAWLQEMGLSPVSDLPVSDLDEQALPQAIAQWMEHNSFRQEERSL